MAESAISDAPADRREAESVVQRTAKVVRTRAAGYLKAIAGLLLLGYAGSKFLTSFVLPVSTEAVVAGTLTTLRAPIAGVLDLDGVDLGTTLKPASRVAAIRNPWADDTMVRDLRGRVELVEAELATLLPQSEALEEFAQGLRNGASLYQLQRVRQLDSLLAETRAQLEADKSQMALNQDHHARTSALLQEGLATEQEVERAEGDRALAEQQVEARTHSLAALESQRKAASLGINVDSGGMGADRPYSRQRLDEVSLELIRVRQRIEAQTRVRDSLKLQLKDAEERLNELSYVTLENQRPSRVWKLFVADRSYVNQGQPVLSLLNCDSQLVVAAVKERVFERLVIGGSAIIEVDGSELNGRIVQLEGLTRADSDDVVVAPGLIGQRDPIPASAAPYRVMISAPGLNKPPFDDCTVGRPGQVRFE